MIKLKYKLEPGEIYEDAIKRSLFIDKVDIRNSLGREVQGRLIENIYDYNASNGRPARTKDYSCTLKMWEEIWRDKVPPIPLSQNKIG
jgi:hypothetical protein